MRAVAVLLLAASVMLVEGFVSPLLGSSSSYALNLAGKLEWSQFRGL